MKTKPGRLNPLAHFSLAALLMAAVTQTSAQQPPASQPAAPPATQPATPENIDANIAKLASKDFAERIAAHKWLHEHLDDAEPALKKMVAATPDAEARKRGQQLLDDAVWGFDIDTPQGLRDGIKAFSTGDGTDELRDSVIDQLRGSPASWSGRVALKLLGGDATDPERAQLAYLVSRGISPVVERALAKGTIKQLLRQLQDDRDETLMRHAAAIRMEMRDPATTPAQAAAQDAGLPVEMRFFAARARGDLATALSIVRDGTYPQYEVDVLVEMNRWSDVGKLLDAQDDSSPAARALAQAFADQGLLSDADAAKLKTLAAAPDYQHSRQLAIIALLVGGRPDEARDLAIDTGNYDAAVSLMLWKNKAADAQALVEKGIKEKKDGALFAAVNFARVLWERGDNVKSEALLKTIEPSALSDPQTMNALFALRTAQKRPLLAKALFMHALEHTRPETLMELLSLAYPDWNEDAVADARIWWFTLEASEPDLELPDRLALVERIVTNKVSVKQFKDLVAEAKPYAGNIRGLSELEVDDANTQISRRLAKLAGDAPKPDDKTVTPLSHFTALQEMIDKCDAQLADPDKNKLVAYFANLLENPGMLDDRQALRYMHGWALTRAGKPEGAAETKSALICMAASWHAHHFTEIMLKLYGDREAAIAEQRRVVAYATESYGWFGPYDTLESLYKIGHDMETVEPFRIASFDLLREQSSPARGISYGGFSQEAGTQQTVLVRRLIAAGKLDEALAKANTLRDHWEIDEDAWMSLCKSFIDAGKKTQGQALLSQMLDKEQAELKDFPDSAPAHNNIAWVLARMRQDLDSALSHAEKSVALQPESAGSWDTLAEVYWAQGDREKAIATEKKAATIDPKDAMFKQRIQHFQNDKLGSMDILDN